MDASSTTGAFKAGNVTIEAKHVRNWASSVLAPISPLLIDSYEAKVTLTGSTVLGRNISITSEGASTTRWDDLGDFADQFVQILTGALAQPTGLVALGVTQETSHATVGPRATITSRLGNVVVHAGGTVGTATGAETAVFQDGNLGVAIAISVDTADILARVDGTVVAVHPTDVLTFDAGAAGVVNVGDDTITISVPDSMKLERGEEIVYTGPERSGGRRPGHRADLRRRVGHRRRRERGQRRDLRDPAGPAGAGRHHRPRRDRHQPPVTAHAAEGAAGDLRPRPG